jgi:hypothetical protein
MILYFISKKILKWCEDKRKKKKKPEMAHHGGTRL